VRVAIEVQISTLTMETKPLRTSLAMIANPARKQRRLALVVGCGVLLLAGSAWFGTFGFSSVCTHCGAMRYAKERQIPLTRITLFRTSSEHQTPVSVELFRSGAVSKHEHQWMFSSGTGNGVRCAIGQGRHIRPDVQSEAVASILNASHRFGEVQFRDRFVQLIFDPKTSESVYHLGFLAPTNDFTDAAEFRAWLDRETQFREDIRSADFGRSAVGPDPVLR